MLAYIEQTNYRIWGFITDCATKRLITAGYVIPALSSCAPGCQMQATKIDHQAGDYHRLLCSHTADTSYLLTVVAPGYTRCRSPPVSAVFVFVLTAVK